MRKETLFGMSLIFVLSFSTVFAIPCMPHLLWGDVTINGSPAEDGLLVEAKISGEVVATTTTENGQYGQYADFYVEDPDCNRVGDIIKIYVGGIYYSETVFENGGGTTESVDLSITTECGNDVCEPGEDSSNCCTDCGCSIGYDCESNTCVEQIVDPYCGDGICNNGENCASCSADCGACPPSGGGGGTYVPPPSSSEPTCGDDSCNGDETCDTCAEDCGACPAECTSNADCDDGNSCTTDTCSEAECIYDSTTICQNGDGCCPSGCTVETDDDCACGIECDRGDTKCEAGKQYTCNLDPFGCLQWGESTECVEGCCDDACCGDSDTSVLETLTGGLTGFAVFDGGFIPFLYIIIGLVIVGGILFYIFRIRK